MGPAHASPPVSCSWCGWIICLSLWCAEELSGQRSFQVPLKVKRDPLCEVSGFSGMISVTIKVTLKLDQINCLLEVSLSPLAIKTKQPGLTCSLGHVCAINVQAEGQEFHLKSGLEELPCKNSLTLCRVEHFHWGFALAFVCCTIFCDDFILAMQESCS